MLTLETFRSWSLRGGKTDGQAEIINIFLHEGEQIRHTREYGMCLFQIVNPNHKSEIMVLCFCRSLPFSLKYGDGFDI